MYTIAVIDDDEYIGDMLEEVLKGEGYGVVRAYSGTEALLLLERQRPDMILLDLMLPGLTGEQVLEKIQGIPVIVISAKIDVQDKVNVLLTGAVDYLTKPFDIRELLARIAVQLRSIQQQKELVEYKLQEQGKNGERHILSFEQLRLDTVLHEASVGEKAVHLTKTEYAILKLLMENPRQVITKSAMLEHISGDTPDCMESSLKVHVSNLRKKLREAGEKDYIEAVWGIGFKLS